MRRTPITDDLDLDTSQGAAPASSAFDHAYRVLVDARADYDAARFDADRVPELASAAARLRDARVEVAATSRAI